MGSVVEVMTSNANQCEVLKSVNVIGFICFYLLVSITVVIEMTDVQMKMRHVWQIRVFRSRWSARRPSQ